MQVTFVVARCFDNTQTFIRALGRIKDVSISLLQGDAPLERALRVLRFAHRVWFEGTGPLLEALIAYPHVGRLRKGYLRLAEEDIPRLPGPDLWKVASDLIVPSRRAAEAALARCGPVPPGAILHVVDDGLRRQILGEARPGDDLVLLADLLAKPPGEITTGAWESILALTDVCRGRILVCGHAPHQLTDYLVQSYGRQVVTAAEADGEPVDSVVFWQDPSAGTRDPARQVAVLGAGRLPGNPPQGRRVRVPAGAPAGQTGPQDLAGEGPAADFARAVARLRPGGVVAAVVPERDGRRITLESTRRLLEEALTGRPAACLRTLGRVVVAQEGEPGPTSPDPSAHAAGDPSAHAAGDPSAHAAGDPSAHAAGAPVVPPAAEGTQHGNSPCRVPAAGPRVSAIIPVYNDAQRVGRAILSLRNQTYRNLEILVIDDGSTDGTAEAVAKHLDDPRVRYFYKPHSGCPQTRNLGLEQARGDYVVWLGSDDELTPNCVRMQMDVIRRRPDVDIVHGDRLLVRADGTFQECRRYRPFTPEELPWLLLAGFSSICPVLDSSVLVRRALYDRLGVYDPAMLRCQDYEFWVRTAIAGDVRYQHVPQVFLKGDQPPPKPERLAAGLDYYWQLTRRIIESFGPERLVDDVARDLQESPCLVLARFLISTAAVYKAPPDHPMWAAARAYGDRVATDGSPVDRSEAWRLRAVAAQFLGDRSLAQAYLARSRESAAAIAASMGEEPAPVPVSVGQEMHGGDLG
jgi:GT2 family glycosyltransferase